MALGLNSRYVTMDGGVSGTVECDSDLHVGVKSNPVAHSKPIIFSRHEFFCSCYATKSLF